MIDLQKLIDFENNFPVLTDCCERLYGKLFYCEANPDSHDSNHAVILDPACDPDRALEDIVSFYEGRGLVPRVYSSFREGELELLQPYLEKHGFAIKITADRLFVLKNPSRILPVPAVEIKKVKTVDQGIIDIICSDGESGWAEKVLQRHILQPDFHLLVGCVEKTPVCIASLNIADGLTRVDDVVTHAGCRGKGYARALIGYLVSYHASISDNALYLWAVNPAAIKIYKAAGFAEVELKVKFWTAAQG